MLLAYTVSCIVTANYHHRPTSATSSACAASAVAAALVLTVLPCLAPIESPAQANEESARWSKSCADLLAMRSLQQRSSIKRSQRLTSQSCESDLCFSQESLVRRRMQEQLNWRPMPSFAPRVAHAGTRRLWEWRSLATDGLGSATRLKIAVCVAHAACMMARYVL